ncbi:MAG: transcription antitermination factor NusB [Proteobacteria bacterium]|nr:transcription antitermination factor NusB [Pseudomonadota bacterium]
MSKPKPSKKARNTASRLVAAQCVYDMIITGHTAAEVLEAYRDHRMGEPLEGIEFVPADFELLSKIVRGVAERRTDLVDMVQGALDKRTGLAEPEALMRAVLLCGAYEMLAHLEIDAPLLISEYNTVAEGFFGDAEVRLVHAVLDRLNKALRA